MKEISISNKVIGKNNPCFIIAEAGLNHNGNLELAKELIKKAKESGADAVKFQTYKTEEITSTKNKTYYQMLKKLELSNEDFKEISEYAKKENIIFFSKASYKEAVPMLKNLGVPAFKIGSSRLTHFPLLKYTAEQNLPLIISTGMATLDEVKEAVNVVEKTDNNQIILLHCTSLYPTKLKDVNLRAMLTLKKFGYPIGYSDHTVGITVPIAAVTLGANVIEKHLTIDKTLLGPDHKASSNPEEFKQMVEAIRNVEKLLGSQIKKPTKKELEMQKLTRISIVANKNIPQNTKITPDMITCKRPGTGIPANEFNDVLGKITKKSIEKDEVIKWDDLV